MLLEALEQPLAGPRRTSDVIRVATRDLADEVRTAVADTIPVVIAPAPELGDAPRDMIEHAPDMSEIKTYMEDDRVQPQKVAELFAAAEGICRVAPWKAAYDSLVLEMDIPALGISGACTSAIGNHGESFGAIVFPSIVGCGKSVEAETRKQSGGSYTVDCGTGWIFIELRARCGFAPGECGAKRWPMGGPLPARRPIRSSCVSNGTVFNAFPVLVT